MPETFDPSELYAIDAAFDAATVEAEVEDDPATTLLEYLSSAEPENVSSPRKRSGGLVSLLVG
jgi:hypothetical protein